MRSPVEKLRQTIAGLTGPVEELRPDVISTGTPEIDAHLPDGGLLTGKVHELLPANYGSSTAVLGFCLALLHQFIRAKNGPVIFCALGFDPNRRGHLFASGLACYGIDPGRLIHVDVPSEKDMLWVMEESLSHAHAAAIVTLLPREEQVYGFSASQRLTLRAAQTGMTAFFIRQHGDLRKTTAAHTRWSVSSAPSRPLSYHGRSMSGLGPARFALDLLKSKNGRPRSWVVEWDYETLSLNLAAPVADRAPLPGRRAVDGPAPRSGFGRTARLADYRHQSGSGRSGREPQPLVG